MALAGLCQLPMRGFRPPLAGHGGAGPVGALLPTAITVDPATPAPTTVYLAFAAAAAPEPRALIPPWKARPDGGWGRNTLARAAPVNGEGANLPESRFRWRGPERPRTPAAIARTVLWPSLVNKRPCNGRDPTGPDRGRPPARAWGGVFQSGCRGPPGRKSHQADGPPGSRRWPLRSPRRVHLPEGACRRRYLNAESAQRRSRGRAAWPWRCPAKGSPGAAPSSDQYVRINADFTPPDQPTSRSLARGSGWGKQSSFPSCPRPGPAVRPAANRPAQAETPTVGLNRPG